MLEVTNHNKSMANTYYIATIEAAEILRITPRGVSFLVRTGKLRYEIKLPGLRGAYLFDRDYILEKAAEKVA